MAELKTQKNDASVEDFLNGVEDEQRREDCFAVLKIMQQATGNEAAMWGESLIGFGSYHYKSDSGREGEWFLTGFSPRKKELSLYIMAGFGGFPELMEKLGKHKTGRSCLYIKKLEDIHLPTLKKLVKQSVKHVKATNKG